MKTIFHFFSHSRSLAAKQLWELSHDKLFLLLIRFLQKFFIFSLLNVSFYLFLKLSSFSYILLNLNKWKT